MQIFFFPPAFIWGLHSSSHQYISDIPLIPYQRIIPVEAYFAVAFMLWNRNEVAKSIPPHQGHVIRF